MGLKVSGGRGSAYVGKIKKWPLKHREFLISAFPAAILLIYLWCCCFWASDIQDAGEIVVGLLSYFRPAVVNSFVILFAYWAWQSYRKENVPAAISVLFAGIAVVLPFAGSVYRPEDWPDCGEKLFGFALILWPVPVTCLSDFCVGKFSKNKKIVFGINTVIVFILAAGLHLFAQGMMEEKWSRDLTVPAVWLAESLLWSAALHFTDKGKNRKRNVVTAWLMCLLIFYCTTFMKASYLSSTHIWDIVRGRYWNSVLFLCWPVLLTVLTRALCFHIPRDKPYFVQKAGIAYFCIVLLISYLLTDISLNFATGAFRDDICVLVYLLFLAEFVVWKEVYGNLGCTRKRIGAFLSLLLLDAGAFIFLLVRNGRLREVLYYMGFSFMGNSLSIPQADWAGYRKAAVRAFFSNDLSMLDSVYKKESYYFMLDGGHGLASIRFQIGMLPLLAMIVLLVITVIILWNWSRDDRTSGAAGACARYFAAGCLLKMLMSVLLQINMVVSPYCEFPFTGVDMPEFVVLMLLVHTGTPNEICHQTGKPLR